MSAINFSEQSEIIYKRKYYVVFHFGANNPQISIPTVSISYIYLNINVHRLYGVLYSCVSIIHSENVIFIIHFIGIPHRHHIPPTFKCFCKFSMCERFFFFFKYIYKYVCVFPFFYLIFKIRSKRTKKKRKLLFSNNYF